MTPYRTLSCNYCLEQLFGVPSTNILRSVFITLISDASDHFGILYYIINSRTDIVTAYMMEKFHEYMEPYGCIITPNDVFSLDETITVSFPTEESYTAFTLVWGR